MGKTPKRMLSKDEILHLAKLANLYLTEEEINKYWKQLEETVEYIKNLNKLDTEKVEPTCQTTNLTNIFFKDGEENKRKLTIEEAIKNAKNKKNGYFTVKRILQK